MRYGQDLPVEKHEVLIKLINEGLVESGWFSAADAGWDGRSRQPGPNLGVVRNAGLPYSLVGYLPKVRSLFIDVGIPA